MARSEVERDEVETPFVQQLKAMGWQHVHGPDLKREGRAYEDVLLKQRLTTAVKKINRLHGGNSPWMTDDHAARAIAELQAVSAGSDGRRLLDANFTSTARLLSGTQMPGVKAHRGQDPHVEYIDYRPDEEAGGREITERNDFLAVTQLEVRTSGGEKSVLDIVLFVNGIPLVVVECKSPDLANPIGDAVRDLRAYSGNPLAYDERKDRRGAVPPGVPPLFKTVQLVIAADGRTAQLGTISSDEEHYAAWRSVSPERDSVLRRELRAAGLLKVPSDDADKAQPDGRVPAIRKALPELTEQQKLIGVVLRPAHLLNIVRHYVIALPVKGSTSGARRIKVVCRHQQYRAVEKMLLKLRTGRTRLDLGAVRDERGGVIWHTQGSGKSLSMAFLTRRLHMHPDPELNQFTVVVVTDRTQLQDQLSGALRVSGSEVDIAKTQADVEGMLKRGRRGVVFAMIQKYGGRFAFEGDADGGGGDDRDLAEEFQDEQARIDAGEDPARLGEKPEEKGEGNETGEKFRRPTFPECSTSPRYLVMVDEAHRSHTSVLHACLRKAVPNAAYVGFTGTPITKGRLTDTFRIFGGEPAQPYIDRYSMDEAETDGVVVRVRYEGRAGEGKVKDGKKLDAKFDDLIKHRSAEEKQALARRWSNPTERDIAESAPMIRKKALDMLEHYVTSVLTAGFKAQVAAVSRVATVRYRAALRDARDELLARVAHFTSQPFPGRGVETLEYAELVLLRTWQYRSLLRRIAFVPVISAGAERKERRWLEWTDPTRRDRHIERFLQDLPQLRPAKAPYLEGAPANPRVTAAAKPSLSQSSALPWSPPSPRMGQTGRVDHGDEEDTPIAFLIVKSMLLTGFDAPIEQVLYLDRPIRDAELLQAVARVNRPASGKDAGFVVDYYGVFANLAQTLAAYREDTYVMGSLLDIEAELPGLREAAENVQECLDDLGITDLDAPGGLPRAVLLLNDESDRHGFDEVLGTFLRSVDRVLPHEDALDHIPDARRWAMLQKRVRRHYRDAPGGTFTLRAYGRKVREMIADHLELESVEQRIPPVSITDAAFDLAVREVQEHSPREAAAEMQHALRFHLEERVRREDPARYNTLSQALADVLESLRDRWEDQIEELGDLIEQARSEVADDPRLVGLSRMERRVYGILEERFTADPAFDNPGAEQLRGLATGVCEVIDVVVGRVSYRGRSQDVSYLAAHIVERLRDVVPMPHGVNFDALERLGEYIAAFAGDTHGSR
ncbi:type I restriction endonuclease [Streptomyces sp. A3M-1-3]|uniref:type I restriction endonuclease subunit R n=1 Tax=Streptomyces sp. A3M-1-3 TaxID=2962044 RepID=UPI0020B8C344|nr:type I restriction endonuclease [Streptomyces sp. A3M-1-3]MCP3818849.1 type I restriction endonuclease [Streptomyces sp. A3M-1-3]